MNNTCIIMKKENKSQILYRIYILNTPFTFPRRYDFKDQTTLIVTDTAGKEDFLTKYLPENRKNNIEAAGQWDQIDDADASEQLLRKIELLMQGATLEKEFPLAAVFPSIASSSAN